MKKVVTLIIASALVLSGCSSSPSASNLDAAVFAGKIVETDVVTLDVRTAGEFLAGHIDGAINIDVEGKYQSGGTKREWSVKGKLKLDNNNSIHIKLEDIGSSINKDFGNFGKSNATPNANASSVSKGDFQKDIREIDGMMSSFDKGAKAKKMARDYKMTSAQIKELISKLNSTFDQKDVAIAAYQNCTDKKNFGIVTESFMSSITKRDVENATINKKD